MIVSFLIAIIIASLLIITIIVVMSVKKSNKKDVKDKIKKKGETYLIKEAEKKLAHDSHNVNALEVLGDISYNNKDWEKTWNIYKTLYDISAAHKEIDIGKTSLRMGIAAFYLKKQNEAVNALIIAVKRIPDSFEGLYYLGRALFEAGTYDKAAFCFKKAKILKPENNELNQYIGLSLFKLQKYRECIPFLKKVLEEKSENKEILFDIAVAMAEIGINERAVKIFMHLRPDPVYGAQSCVEAGKIHERNRDYLSAVQDYEIGMKLQNVPEQIMLTIKYRCANSYIQMKEISKALALFKQIQMVKTGYKDVDALVVRYNELNQNKNLQTYLMAGTSDFIALCRRLVSTYHKDCFIKIEDVQVISQSAELVCTVESSKWSAKELFRFYRTQTVIGDIFIREFHTKIRDLKCDNGVCVTMGSFSESSHKYCEGRPIDLIEKDELCKILKKINVFG